MEIEIKSNNLGERCENLEVKIRVHWKEMILWLGCFL